MKIPDYKKVIYRYNGATDYYETITAPPAFNKLPYDVKIVETQAKNKIQSSLVIRSRIKNGKYVFFTCIRETSSPYWYYGDHAEWINVKKKQNLILFNLTSDNQVLTAYYFRGITKVKGAINQFVVDLRTYLQNQPG